jgi:hypothetical protein
MTSALIAAPTRGGAITRGDLVRLRIDAFRESWRGPVAALCARHPWIADLAVSFPALLAQAAAKGARAEPGLSLAMAGAPLPEIARALGVAMWLRALPARAFDGEIALLPDSVAFRRQIANVKPKSWRHGPVWLEQIAFAARWGGEDFAVWVAKTAPLSPVRRRGRNIGRRRAVTFAQCLWAWHSQRPAWAFASTIETPWRPEMNWGAACKASCDWLEAVELTARGELTQLATVWPAACAIDGFAFMPIRTLEDLNAEADSMRHCVKSYVDDLANVETSLWSVRVDGVRAATLRLRRADCALPFIAICQLKGRENAAVSAAVWRAARKFALLADKDVEELAPLVQRGQSKCPKVWRAMWRDYWRAMPKAMAWLSVSPPKCLWEALNWIL